MNFPRALQRLDGGLLLAAFVLVAFGVAAITSVELSRGIDDFVLVRKQLIALALGIGVCGGALALNVQTYRAFARLGYALSVGLLLSVLLFGQTFNGTTGWFVLFGVSFQPVELMKIALGLELARYFSDQARDRFGWRELFGSGWRVALPTGLLMLQPDLGGAVIMLGIWFLLILAAGVRWFHLAAMAGAAAALVLVGWIALGQLHLAPYQLARIETFLNPTSDPLGSGYNVTQAKIAIGAGGLIGRGLGGGSQSQLRFLPESQTDFIFAVIAEELGLLGVTLVFLAYLVLFWRVAVVIRASRDSFAVYALCGLAGTLFLQSSVHIGVNLALIPATGVTLPFVSYGGTSLIMSLLMLGIMESIARRVPPVDRLAPG